jgi:hypothetical protein
METPIRAMPLSRRMPKTILPRSIQTNAQPDDVPQTAPATTTYPDAYINNTVQEPNMPSSTIQWMVKDINRTVYAGEACLIVNGHSNFIEARASKLYIKADGVYCIQVVGSNCDVSIDAIVMNGVVGENPVQLSAGTGFVSVTCFMRKNDVLSLKASPKIVKHVQPVYDPNQRLHGHRVCDSKCDPNDKVCNNVCFSMSLI